MPVIGQNLIVLALTLLSAGYLLFRCWSYVVGGSGKGGCGGGCSSCSSASSTQSLPGAGEEASFVPLDQLRDSARKQPTH